MTWLDRDRRMRLAGQVDRVTEWPMLALAVAMIPVLLVPMLLDLRPWLSLMLTVCEWAIWAAFAVELVVKTYLAPHRRQYLVRHWFDVLTVALPFLRPLRLLRLVGLISRLGITSRSFVGRRALGALLLFGLCSMVTIAVVVMLLERQHEEASITSFGIALWWAAATVTTVGYGDVAPLTWAGRGLGVVMMILGIALFGIFTANVAAWFVGAGETQESDEVLRKAEAVLEEAKALLQQSAARGS